MSFQSPATLAVQRSLVASSMTERVTLVRPGAETRDGFGAAVPGTPVEVATVAARVTPQGAPERVEADRLTGGGTYTVRVHGAANAAVWDAHGLPASDWTATWTDALGVEHTAALTADAVDDHGRSRFLDLLCAEGAPVGAGG